MTVLQGSISIANIWSDLYSVSSHDHKIYVHDLHKQMNYYRKKWVINCCYTDNLSFEYLKVSFIGLDNLICHPNLADM